MAEPTYYRRPGWAVRHLFNGVVVTATRCGVSVWGSRVLEVPGRRTGLARRVPVNLLSFEGTEYLVAPRGESEWVRNVRAAGGHLDLLLGRRRQHRHAAEVADDDKPPVLRAYLRRWRAEVGAFFDGVGPDAPDDRLRAVAHRHPVFRLDPVR